MRAWGWFQGVIMFGAGLLSIHHHQHMDIMTARVQLTLAEVRGLVTLLEGTHWSTKQVGNTKVFF